MTRKKLKEIGSDKRHSYCGTFSHFGTTRGRYPKKTLLLKDVFIINEDNTRGLVTDHLWFKCGKAFESLNLSEGDQVFFDGRVSSYKKGFEPICLFEQETDYRLDRPTNVYKVSPDGTVTKFQKAHTEKGMATARQKSRMDKLNIPYTSETTSVEANKLIEEFENSQAASPAMLEFRDKICARRHLTCDSSNWKVVHKFINKYA